jgi:hypothetical protein
MATNRLKFVCIYKISTMKIISSGCNEKSGEEQIKNESLKVGNQIKSINLSP